MTKRSLFPLRFAARALAIIAVVQAAGGCATPDRTPDPAVALVPYLGQPAPGTTPQHFAPGIVNSDAIEINGVFTPDGRTFFFAREIEGVFTIFRSDFGESGWASPAPMDVYADGTRTLEST